MGKLDGISVALVGDLAYGRTVRSLAYLLAKYRDVKIYFVAPDVVRMKVRLKRTFVVDHCFSYSMCWKHNISMESYNAIFLEC